MLFLFIVEGIPYRCVVGICPKVFQAKSQMMIHIQSSHGLKMLLVDENEEMRLHPAPNKKFQCPQCSSSFTRNSRRREHIISKHPELDPNSAPQPQTVIAKQISPAKPPARVEDKKQVVTVTTFPKKYFCDMPGCDKGYTKSSHVTRYSPIVLLVKSS